MNPDTLILKESLDIIYNSQNIREVVIRLSGQKIREEIVFEF